MLLYSSLGDTYAIISAGDILREMLGYECPRLGCALARTRARLPTSLLLYYHFLMTCNVPHTELDIGDTVMSQIQLTWAQRGFALHGSTWMWIFFQ